MVRHLTLFVLLFLFISLNINAKNKVLVYAFFENLEVYCENFNVDYSFDKFNCISLKIDTVSSSDIFWLQGKRNFIYKHHKHVFMLKEQLISIKEKNYPQKLIIKSITIDALGVRYEPIFSQGNCLSDSQQDYIKRLNQTLWSLKRSFSLVFTPLVEDTDGNKFTVNSIILNMGYSEK